MDAGFNITPEMFKALVAMSKEVKTIAKGGWNDQSKYTYAVADAVIKESRELLASHGMGWMRTSQKLLAPALLPADIGRQYYVGDVEIFGYIYHEGGGMIPVSAMVGIVAKAASPHDKAGQASATYGTGYLLLGFINADREGKHASVDDREDEEEPRCVGKCDPIATAVIERAQALGDLDGHPREAVFGWACGKCDVPKFDGEYPGPKDLLKSEGLRVSALLKATLAKRQPSQPSDPGDDPNPTREDGCGP